MSGGELLSFFGVSAVGVAALLTASATAFTVVKVAGAIYLGYLGIQALRAAIRGDAIDEDARGRARTHEAHSQSWRAKPRQLSSGRAPAALLPALRGKTTAAVGLARICRSYARHPTHR